MEIKTNYPRKKLNTFALDVKALFYAEISEINQLSELYKDNPGVNKMIIGGGSNILFSKNYDGMLIRNMIKGIKIIFEDDETVLIEAGAGEIWDDLVKYTVGKNYGGMENLSLIPGTVGASPIQNIGAYGVEIKDIFKELKALNIETGEVETFSGENCRFGYRDSVFKKEFKNKYVITSVTYSLRKNRLVDIRYEALKNELIATGIKDPTIKEVRDIVCRIRKSKLPDPEVLGNAGSFFKNPEISKEQFDLLKAKYSDIPGYRTEGDMMKIPAGWLIQKCGWKGKRLGQTGVYEKQALVLINYGGATGREIVELSEAIKDSIKKEFGIILETEVNII
ncbi:MAG: UDP-N-acetylmuramate dehydrogenase [Bacillota bacterium]